MSELPSPARQMLDDNLGLIREITHRAARRRRLSRDDEEELASYVWLRLVEEDCRILRSFRGRSSLRTFLITVIHRLLLDFRTERWGKWRPSAEARRLGPEAVEMERLLGRDGRTLENAVEILCRLGEGRSREELAALAGRLPVRVRPRREGEQVLRHLPAGEHADDRVRERESREALGSTWRALGRALRELPAQDRLILRLRYEQGMTVRGIAAALELPDRPLYRRLERCLERLRATLEREGAAPC